MSVVVSLEDDSECRISLSSHRLEAQNFSVSVSVSLFRESDAE